MNSRMFLPLVFLCVITHIVRLIYEILKHKKLIKASGISFVIIFSNMLLLWTSWFLLCSFDPSAISFPLVFRYFGISLAILGVIIFLTALFTINVLYWRYLEELELDKRFADYKLYKKKTFF